jgi:fructokinase
LSPLLGGVETGGTWCVCALAAGPDEVERLERFPTSEPVATVGRILDFFGGGPAPAAVGIGAFGPVDLTPSSPGWGSTRSTPKPGWSHVALAGPVGHRLGVPVAFDTDVNAAAVGEHRWGAGRGVDSLCYVTVGTGIGAGLLFDGQPRHGLIHPEAGHLRVPHDQDRDPFPGSCPVHGDCWEGLASGQALAARWGRQPDELPDDHPAWELEAEYLALGLLAIVCVAAPERVVLGGGVMGHAGLRDLVASRLRDLVAGYFDSPLLGDDVDSFVLAPGLGDRAGVLGAVALAGDLLEPER